MRTRSCRLRYLCLAVIVVSLAFACPLTWAARPGDPVDVVPFGELTKWDDRGNDYGVIWEDARDVFRVVATFADPAAAPKPDAIKLQYWQSSWPHRRIPREAPSGSGSSGWLDVGDWHQGRWQAADAKVRIDGPVWIFTFNPVNAKEFPKLEDFAADYRSTLKLRLVADAPLPKIASFQAFADSTWQPLELEIEWGGTADKAQTWDGQLEAFNGRIEAVAPLSPAGAVKVADDRSWKSTIQGKTDGIRAKILLAEVKGHNSFDETVITVRSAAESFSFAPVDLLKGGPIFLPDFGVLIRKAGDKTTYAAAHEAWQQNKNKNIYTRVATVEEQTFPKAWNDIPAKGHHYIPLSFEGGRQHFGLDENGEAFCNWHWLAKIPGKDTKRCLYDGDDIRYRFGLAGAALVDRQIVDGCLPMIVGVWERDGVRYRQTAFVVPFAGVPSGNERIYGDDTLVLMIRIEMEKIGASDAQAALDIDVKHDKPEKPAFDKGLIFADGSDPRRLRMLVTSSDSAESYSLKAGDRMVAYRANLTARAPKRTLDAAIPYITFTDPKEWDQLRSIRFDEQFAAVRAYWQQRIASGAQITTPEPAINDFYKAHVSHLLINTEREAGTSDRYMVKVGTFHYGAFSNESCMMVSDLDRRGYHKRAEQALESWLHYQGTVGLPGDFTTKEGQFYGAGGYEHGGYNQHHGWVLWCLGEHYWYTRDGAWLAHAAPYIVKGCDWIIGQRQRTIDQADKTPIRAIERGLLPQGRLEDIGDWRSWLSTNVYSWWGMKNAAAALAAARHPDGQRLLAEAQAYGKDILAAYTQAMQRSPVVRLRDGSSIPHIPPDVHRRGRTFGWITETLEGAIHMIRCEMLDPWDRLSTWIIKDYEDNLYISEQYGYNITGEDFDRYWFSRGGISQQANLLCNPIPYLQRDEPKHFLRAYFNAFTVSYFPDTRMMTEHALPNIGDWRGDHYKSSDEANSTYWLRMMFIQERGDELWLGAAIPRYWLTDGQKIGIQNAGTYFGPMSVRLESRAARGEIEMIVNPPVRNAPKLIRARFRHPEAREMKSCEVNGKPCDRIEPGKEWVVLTDCSRPVRIVARYE